MEYNTNNASRGEIVIYQTVDGKTSIDVRFENDTVWLTQDQMNTSSKATWFGATWLSRNTKT